MDVSACVIKLAAIAIRAVQDIIMFVAGAVLGEFSRVRCAIVAHQRCHGIHAPLRARCRACLQIRRNSCSVVLLAIRYLSGRVRFQQPPCFQLIPLLIVSLPCIKYGFGSIRVIRFCASSQIRVGFLAFSSFCNRIQICKPITSNILLLA